MKRFLTLMSLFWVSIWIFSQCSRTPLPPPAGSTTQVATMTELRAALNAANSSGGNHSILLEDGTYFLDEMLHVTADRITVRSLSGIREAVQIWGAGMGGSIAHVFLISASHFTCADLTLGRVANHGIQIRGEADADFPLIHNVRFEDTFEQMLKVSYDSGTGVGSDGGVVEWCHFEYTAGIGPQFYIGGVDAHHATGWEIAHNEFIAIRSPDGTLAEHAIHMWSFSEDTYVHHNRITNCDRGIGFGLGSSGHVGGEISNNMIHTTRDVSIGLESSPGTSVYNNSVFTENYFNSIEYRFSATSGVNIANNLTNQAIASRNDGTATLTTNFSSAAASWFEDPFQGDLHLTEDRIEVVDQGSSLPTITTDFDCNPRPFGANYDLGADEYACGLIGSTWGDCIASWDNASPPFDIMEPLGRVDLFDLLFWFDCLYE